MSSPNYLMDVDGKYQRVSEIRNTYYRLVSEQGSLIDNFDSLEDAQAVRELHAQEDIVLIIEKINEVSSVVRYISVM